MGEKHRTGADGAIRSRGQNRSVLYHRRLAISRTRIHYHLSPVMEISFLSGSNMRFSEMRVQADGKGESDDIGAN